MTFQGSEASFDDAPDDFNVNAEVLVDQDVSVGRDAPPGNLCMLSPEVQRQISDRLANDLQILDGRILHHGVRKEHAPARSDVGLDSGNGVPSVSEEDCSVFHSGRASARTRSRKCGLRPFSVTTSTAQLNRSSRSGLKPARCSRSRPGPRSTSRSRSLVGRPSRCRCEPNARRRLIPCTRARRRVSIVLRAFAIDAIRRAFRFKPAYQSGLGTISAMTARGDPWFLRVAISPCPRKPKRRAQRR